MSDWKRPDQHTLARELLDRCGEDGQVDDATAEVVKTLLREYHQQCLVETGPGRPPKALAREHLAKSDALDRVYGAIGSQPGKEASQRSNEKHFGISRRSIGRWRAEPEFQRLVDRLEQEEWDWINSEDFEPD